MKKMISFLRKNKTVKWYIEYQWALYSAQMIFLWLIFVPYCYWGKDIPGVIIAVAGLMSQIPLGLFWKSFNRPILKIEGVEFNELTIHGEWVYKINSVIVKNVGRSAAKNCKGYISVWDINKEEKKIRVCWTLSTERPNATINVEDYEMLNVCAFYIKGAVNPDTTKPPPEIIIPTELDWVDHYKATSRYPWEFRHLTKVDFGHSGDRKFIICVTAENAKVAEVLVKSDEINKKIIIIENLR